MPPGHGLTIPVGHDRGKRLWRTAARCLAGYSGRRRNLQAAVRRPVADVRSSSGPSVCRPAGGRAHLFGLSGRVPRGRPAPDRLAGTRSACGGSRAHGRGGAQPPGAGGADRAVPAARGLPGRFHDPAGPAPGRGQPLGFGAVARRLSDPAAARTALSGDPHRRSRHGCAAQLRHAQPARPAHRARRRGDPGGRARRGGRARATAIVGFDSWVFVGHRLVADGRDPGADSHRYRWRGPGRPGRHGGAGRRGNAAARLAERPDCRPAGASSAGAGRHAANRPAAKFSARGGHAILSGLPRSDRRMRCGRPGIGRDRDRRADADGADRYAGLALGSGAHRPACRQRACRRRFLPCPCA